MDENHEIAYFDFAWGILRTADFPNSKDILHAPFQLPRSPINGSKTAPFMQKSVKMPVGTPVAPNGNARTVAGFCPKRLPCARIADSTRRPAKRPFVSMNRSRCTGMQDYR